MLMHHQTLSRTKEDLIERHALVPFQEKGNIIYCYPLSSSLAVLIVGLTCITCTFGGGVHSFAVNFVSPDKIGSMLIATTRHLGS